MEEMPAIKINEALVEELSKLVRISLSREEVERLIGELELLLGYINDILEMPVEGCEEFLYPNPVGRLRADEPSFEGKGRKHLLGALLEEGYVKAPRVVAD